MRYMIGAAAMALVGIALAGIAHAAPSGPGTVTETVSSLHADGFHVILNKVGTAALDQCSVESVRQGQTFSRMDSGAPGAGSSITTTVTSKTVYVDVVC